MPITPWLLFPVCCKLAYAGFTHKVSAFGQCMYHNRTTMASVFFPYAKLVKTRGFILFYFHIFENFGPVFLHSFKKRKSLVRSPKLRTNRKTEQQKVGKC